VDGETVVLLGRDKRGAYFQDKNGFYHRSISQDFISIEEKDLPEFEDDLEQNQTYNFDTWKTYQSEQYRLEFSYIQKGRTIDWGIKNNEKVIYENDFFITTRNTTAEKSINSCNGEEF